MLGLEVLGPKELKSGVVWVYSLWNSCGNILL